MEWLVFDSNDAAFGKSMGRARIPRRNLVVVAVQLRLGLLSRVASYQAALPSAQSS